MSQSDPPAPPGWNEELRKDEKYAGYYLSLKTMDLHRVFRLVGDAGG